MHKTNLKVQNLQTGIFTGAVRAIRLGFLNFWRNKILSLATIVVIAVILFIFNIILAVHTIADQALNTLSQHLDINVDLRGDIEFYDAQNFKKTLEKIPGVQDVQYRSKEEALDIVAKTHPETVELYKKFSLKNPLPPSLIIRLQKPEVYNDVQNFLKKSEYRSLLANSELNGQNKDSVVLSAVGKNLANMNGFVGQIIFWIVLIFVLGGALVIINAIQLTIYTRRNEISIMRLVGASPGFISMPFIFEGILYSLIAVLLSFLLLLFLSQSIQIKDSNLWNFYASMNLGKIFLSELGATMILGVASSILAIEQYWKKQSLP